MATTASKSIRRKALKRVRSGAVARPSLGNTNELARVYTLGAVERIALAKHGVPAADFSRFAQSLGTPKEGLMRMLGLPRATVDRKVRARQPLSVEHSERVIGFAKLVGQVKAMVDESGDPTGFDAGRWLADWLARPLPALRGHRPAEYMDTSEGQQLVAGLLGRMQSGAYA